MEKTFHFYPKGTCSREIIITYDGDILRNLEVIGGCNGNLKGISSLVKNRPLIEVYESLKGIKCGFKNTSCPDQISKAIQEILNNIN